METEEKVSRCIDFDKLDSKRSADINDLILKKYHAFINSPGIVDILRWYKSQNWLLYIDYSSDGLRFCGCEDSIDHHSSNIEWIVKCVLHKMLHDNASKKILLDRHKMSLAAFGFIEPFSVEESGNVYQGFERKTVSNIPAFQVLLSQQQVMEARNILRLINGKQLVLN